MFEWRQVFLMGKKGQPLKTAIKYPYHINIKNGKPPLMARLWNAWKHTEVDESTGEVQTINTATFTIVTSKANALMAQVHNSKERMPTILTKELAHEWLQPDLTEERILQIATNQFAADEMHAYAVRKEFQEVIDPNEEFEYQDLAPVVC